AAEKVGRDIDHPVAHDPEGEVAQRYGPGEGVFLIHDGSLEWQKTPGNEFDELHGKLEELTGKTTELELEHRDSQQDIYLGYGHGDAVNSGFNFRGEKELDRQSRIVPGRVHLEGTWRREEEELEAVEGSLKLHNSSRAMGLVASASGLKDIEVRMDGDSVPASVAGDDLRVENGRSYLRVNGKELYSVLEGNHRSSGLKFEPEKGVKMHRLSFR
ncbi:MAG: hypothetical protein ABEJ66_03880, partial [Candidatus Nanohaloarchaea archaeon]